ncbi:phosphofructokinase-domain-containing protein [Blastocladiella britannica]|nr:phosphofructokinase-domain-containing protein [Blastocladiella britannica]
MDTPTLSHITLRAADRELLQSALAFYTSLGFAVVREDDQGHWLVYFSLPGTGGGPTSPTPGGGNNALLNVTPTTSGGIGSGSPAVGPRQVGSPIGRALTPMLLDPVLPSTLHLRLADADAPVRATPVPEQLNAAPVSLIFTAADLLPLERLCLNKEYRSQAMTRKDGAGYLYVADPLGNVVVFTTKAHPLSSRLLSSSSAASASSAGSGPTTIPYTETTTYKVAADLAAAPPTLTSTPSSQSGASTKHTTVEPKRIGILTSGGDSQGMNAAVRSVVRMCHIKGCKPFAIYDGYQGLVDNRIIPFGWADVQGLLRLGGTVIGTARCLAFRERAGRLLGALNLVMRGIDALVVVGGDGSLTGADKLRSEWPSLLDELLQNNKITADQREKYAHLTIVGLVGSIDNDMSSTDMTIGCASALHRICEAIDAIEATALSHSRAFVIEVMGRHCGWLALMAALATGADWLFVPERPVMTDDWKASMCEHLARVHHRGQKKIMVIVSEGAIDRELNPIKAETVRDVLDQQLGLDARVTTLGHVQRGGSPAFYDRYLGTVQGVRAVEEILRSTPSTPSPMIGVSQNKITVHPLVKAVELTHAVSAAIERKEFARAMELRDPEFAPTFDTFVAMNNMPPEWFGATAKSGPLAYASPSPSAAASPITATAPPSTAGAPPTGLKIGILHLGAPAGGVNAATRAAALLALNRGHTPVAIYNGIDGLIRGDTAVITRRMVLNWTARGGSELGTNRDQPGDQLGVCAYQLQRLGLHALMFVGGFEAFTALHTLTKARDQYPALCIPMVLVPATISNNVPGTDYSLGSDTALNEIVSACDKLKQSASASRRRVFVMEVHGGNVGYLATLGALAGGATSCYIPEEGLNLATIQRDVDHLRKRYEAETGSGAKQGRVVLRNENVSECYTTEVMCSILRAESQGEFDARAAVLGHLQQGGAPSPLDRTRATRLAAMCIDWIERHTCDTYAPALAMLGDRNDGGSYPPRSSSPTNGPVYTKTRESACVIGIRGADLVFTPVVDLMLLNTDLKNRRAREAWWMTWRGLVPLLAGYAIPPQVAVEQFARKPEGVRSSESTSVTGLGLLPGDAKL